jgi:hypothetical protein
MFLEQLNNFIRTLFHLMDLSDVFLGEIGHCSLFMSRFPLKRL